MGKDPIAFKLELINRAAKNPVGSNNDYDTLGCWNLCAINQDGIISIKKGRGVAAYFWHNFNVALVERLTRQAFIKK